MSLITFIAAISSINLSSICSLLKISSERDSFNASASFLKNEVILAILEA